MEKENKIIPAINPTPSNEPIDNLKIITDRYLVDRKNITEEEKSNLNPLFS
jgi:hypothetical protein